MKQRIRKASGTTYASSPAIGDWSFHDEVGSIREKDDIVRSFVQWTSSDGRIFVPASRTTASLIPAVYEINQSPAVGLYFERIPVKTEGLVRFPETNSDCVVKEIQTFWEKQDIFEEYGLVYKRGILLYGPPGSGKSSTIQLIIEDVIKRGGIVVKFTEPILFINGMRILRQIQPDIPVVAIMEDIDAILDRYNESEVLNILDGVNEVHKTVFLATTNYTDRLGDRIVNRPSRFDKRFRIGFPNPTSRELFFRHLIKEKSAEDLKIDLPRWVADTDEMSIAHLKELFIAFVILGDPYEEVIETLKGMKEIIKDKDYDTPMGFGTSRSRDFYN